MTAVQLHVVTSRGPVPLEPPGGAAAVHEVLDDLPQGVYSGLRTFGHVHFLRLDLHLARTRRCARASGWPDFDEHALRAALHATCAAWPEPDARVRFDVLAEPTRFGASSGRALIVLSPFVAPPAAFLREGVGVEIAHGLQRERPEIKTSDFVLRRRPFPLGTQAAFEHLLLDQAGRILEGTSSNFFGLRDGTLFSAGEGVLDGVTRRIVLELADALGLPAREEAVVASAAGELDEAFLTSSTRALVPIVSVAGARVGDGSPGPTFRRLLAEYEAYAAREARPALE